jgi:hypothetical protein
MNTTMNTTTSTLDSVAVALPATERAKRKTVPVSRRPSTDSSPRSRPRASAVPAASATRLERRSS